MILLGNGPAPEVYGVVCESLYGYDDYDKIGVDFTVAPYTRINYQYRPQPENNGPWSGAAGGIWQMYYGFY